MFNRVQPVLGDAETDVEAQQEENAVALTKDINNEETVVRSGSLCAAVYLLGPGTAGAEV